MLFVFDIDGTLLLSGGAGARALDQAFERLHGLSGAMAAVAAEGKTDPLIVDEVFETRLGRRPADEERSAVLELYLAMLPDAVRGAARYRLMPGLPAVLDAAGRRGTLALATGNIERGATVKLERGSLAKYFLREGRLLGGFGSDSADRATLTRLAVRRGLEAASCALAPRDILVIGDTPRDVVAAHAAGAVAVAVCTGPFGVDSLREVGADVILRDLTELLPWVDARAIDGAVPAARMAAP